MVGGEGGPGAAAVAEANARRLSLRWSNLPYRPTHHSRSRQCHSDA